MAAMGMRLPPLPPLTARCSRTPMATEGMSRRIESSSPRTQRFSVEAMAQRPATPCPEAPRRPQTPRSNSDGSTRSSHSSNTSDREQPAAGVTADLLATNGMRERCFAAHEGSVAKRTRRSGSKCLRAPCADGPLNQEQAAAGVAADLLAANGMRERCVAAHEGAVAKFKKRSATKCLRAASVGGNESNEVKRRQEKMLQERAQLIRVSQPPFAVDLTANRFESRQGRLLADGSAYRSGSATARGPRESSQGSSTFLRNLDLTYGGARWAGPGSRCRTPTSDTGSFEDKELEKVCDLVGEKVEERFQNPRECLKCVNTHKDGFVTCSEVQAFFRTFNVPDETAQRIFDRLDPDGFGLIDYQQFKNFVEQRIKPKTTSLEETPCSTAASTRAPSVASNRRSSPTEEDDIDCVSANVPALSRWEMQRKLARAVQMIAEKANLKYPSFRELRHAFRWVDLSKDGKVTRDEVENFFRVFAVPIETAEYLFVLFDAEDSDEINHSDFVEVFGPAMGIGHQEPSCKKQIELPGKRDLEREINDIMRIMASHMLKFAHPREALRSLDLSHDGRITRNELRAFFQRFGLEHTSADRVFDLLHIKDDVHDDLETCSYHEFMNLFDPVMQPAHYEENGYIQDC